MFFFEKLQQNFKKYNRYSVGNKGYETKIRNEQKVKHEIIIGEIDT